MFQISVLFMINLMLIALNKIITIPNAALMFVPLTFIIPLVRTLSDACVGELF